MLKRAIFIFIIIGAFIFYGNAQKPKTLHNKIMSINACTDQLVLSLAEPKDIASLSYYTSDKKTSSFANEAAKYHKNNMTPEEIIAINPEIILKSPFEKDVINQIIEKQNIKSESFGVPNSIKEAQELVKRAGNILDANTKAKLLNDEIEIATIPSLKPKIPALIYFSGGNSAGDNTLINEILENEGFENMAKYYGVGNWGNIDIERIIAKPPKIMFIEANINDTNGEWANRALNHPALLDKSLGIKFIPFPSSFGYCGGAMIPKISNYFKEIRNHYE